MNTGHEVAGQRLVPEAIVVDSVRDESGLNRFMTAAHKLVQALAPNPDGCALLRS